MKNVQRRARLASASLALLLLAGCRGAGHSASDTVERTAAMTTEAVTDARGGSVKGEIFYADRSTRGLWAMKVRTAQGTRVFYVSPTDQKKPFAQADYAVGTTCLLTYKPDPTAEGDGLLTAVKPLGPPNRDVGDALAIVNRFYDDIYFLHLDDAYTLMSSAAHQKVGLQAFKDEWPPDHMASIVDWNAHFAPRREGLDSHDPFRMGVLVDITRLLKGETRSDVRRVTVVREGGQWRIDQVERADPDDFLQ